MAELTADEIIAKINTLETALAAVSVTAVDVTQLDVSIKNSQQKILLLKELEYWQKRLESIPTFIPMYIVEDGEVPT